MVGFICFNEVKSILLTSRILSHNLKLGNWCFTFKRFYILIGCARSESTNCIVSWKSQIIFHVCPYRFAYVAHFYHQFVGAKWKKKIVTSPFLSQVLVLYMRAGQNTISEILNNCKCLRNESFKYFLEGLGDRIVDITKHTGSSYDRI